MNIFSNLWLNRADQFDRIQRFFNRDFWQTFIKNFGNLKGKNILDLACGTGKLSDYINAKSYLGVDLNSAYIKFAKNSREGVNVKFILGDVTKYQPSRRFDFATLISAIHHLSDTQIQMIIYNLTLSKVDKLIIVDGFPIGSAAPLLKYLDDKLGGGKYFRTLDQLKETVVGKRSGYKIKIERSGELNSKSKFYKYPFLVLSFKNES